MLYVRRGYLSCGIHNNLTQYFIHLCADDIYIGYLPKSPSTASLHADLLEPRKRLHAYICTVSTDGIVLRPHNSEPYNNIGATLLSNSLKKFYKVNTETVGENQKDITELF